MLRFRSLRVSYLRGSTLLELNTAIVIISLLASIALPTYHGILNRGKDKAHLLSIEAIASAASTTYAQGSNGETWLSSLAKVTDSASLAAGTVIAAPAPIALISASQGASLGSSEISYATTPDQLGLASRNQTGTCSMVTTTTTGIADAWVIADVGANCTGVIALDGKGKVVKYLAPSDFGPPAPITMNGDVTQLYDANTNSISYPTFSFTPSLSGDVATVAVSRDGTVVASLSPTATSFTDTTALPGKNYIYTFTVIDQSALNSTPVILGVTTKPGALTGGNVTYSVANSLATATLSWNAPLSSEVITGYHIYRNGSLVNSLIGRDNVQVILPGQQLGIPYTYVVLPYNSAGEGLGFQASAIFIGVGDAPYPIWAAATNASVNISWPAVTSTVAKPVSGYYLYRSVSGGPYLFLTILSGISSTSYLDTSVTNGVPYSYEVASYGAAGTGLQSAASVVVTPVGTPLAGSVVTPTVDLLSISFGISFPTSAANPVGYFIVSRNGVTISSNYPASSTSFTDSAITPQATYTYSVVAVNSSGQSPTATTSPVLAALPPATPTIANILPGNQFATLNWIPSSATPMQPVNGYRIYRSTAGSSYTLISVLIGKSSSTFTDNALTNGTPYTYQVEAYGIGGTSIRTTSPAVTPIGTPASLTITSASSPLNGGSATVSFTSVSTASNPVTSIVVTRNGVAYTTLAPSATTFTDTTVTNGVGYVYTLTAKNSLYSSTPTSTATLTPFGTAPTPSIASTSAGNASAALTWAAIAPTVAIPVDGYRLYRSVAGGAFTLLTQIIPASATSYTDTGLTNGQNYTYQLTAYGAGGESTRSASSSTVTPIGNPAAVTITSAAGVSGGGAITVTFTTTSTTAAPISAIVVTRNGVAYTTLASAATTFTDATVTNGVAYTYAITTQNPIGSSSPVSSAATTAYAISTTPTITSALPANAAVTVNWNPLTPTTGTPIDGYRLYRSVAGGAFTFLTQVLNSTTTSYLDSGLSNGTTYAYQLTGYGAGGESTRSAPSLTTTPLGVPIAPVITTATAAAGGGSVTVGFTTISTTSNPVTAVVVTRNGATYTTLAAGVNSFTDTTITNGTTYTYSLSTQNSLYSSAAVSSSAVTPYAPPSAPTLTTATATSGQVAISWSPGASVTGAPLSGYRLYSSTNGGAYLLLTVQAGTSYTDTTATNGTPYTYQVEAYGIGGTSIRTTSPAVTPIGTPASLTITSASSPLNGGSATVSFTSVSTASNPVTSIVVTRNGVAYTTLAPSATTFTDTTVTNGVGYVYTLTAKNSLYSSTPTSTATLTPFGTAPTPSIASTSAGNASAALTWAAIAPTVAIPVDGYRLYRSVAGGAFTLLTQIIPASATSYTDTGLTNGQNYTYQLTAYGAGGESTRSASSSTVTPIGNPAAVTITSAAGVSGGGAITVTFTTTSTTAAPISAIVVTRNGVAYTTLASAATTFTDATVTNGVAYTYAITTQNPIGSSSPVSSAATTAYAISTTPTITSALPANAAVTVNWNPLTPTTGTPIDGYRLYRSVAGGAFTFLTQVLNSTTTSYLDSGLSNGTTYAYQLTGYGAGGESTRSASSSTVTPLGVPAAIVITSASSPLNGGSATVSFTSVSTASNPVTSIVVTRNGVAYTTLAPSATTFTDTTVTNGVGYVYTLTAKNSLYSSTPTSTATLTPFGTAPTPSIASTSAGNASAALTWAAIAPTVAIPVDGYRLYRSVAGGAFTLLTQIIPASATSYTDTGLTNGQNYTYQLTAYGAGGESTRSASSSTVTPIGNPAAVTITSAAGVSGGGAITVTFTTTSTTAAPISAIVVTRNGVAYTTLASAATTFTDATVTNGVAYTYAITTQNPIGSSSPVSSAATTAYAISTTPTITSALPANAAVTVNWNPLTPTTGTPIDGYRLYRSVAGGAFTFLTQVLNSTTTSYLDSGLSNGTTYAYQLTGYGAGGESTRSASSSTVTPLGVPAAIVITSASSPLNGGSATVSFTSVSTASNPVTSIVVTRNGVAYTTLAPSATTFTDTTVTNGVGYVYTLTAKNSLYSSTPTSTATLTPFGTAPTPSIASTSAGNASAALTWAAIAPTVAIPVDGYRLYRSVAGGAFTLLTQIIPASATSYTDTGLTNGQNYTYQLTAYGAGGESTRSASSSTVTPIGNPAAVTITSAAGVSGGGAITVTFTTTSTTAAPISAIVVTRNGVAYTTLASAATTFTDATVTNGVAYTYAITTQNPIGSSSPVSSAATTAYATPATPTITSVVPANTVVTVNWNPLTSTTGTPITGYTIFRSVGGAGYTQLLQVTGSATVAYADTSVTNGNSYSYKVAAYGAGGQSANSAPSSSVTPLGVPAAVTITSATAALGGGSITVTFTTTSTTTNPVTAVVVTRNGAAYTTLGSASTGFTDTTVTNGTPYIYGLTTQNALYNSTVVASPSVTAYAAPTAPAFTANLPTAGQVSLSWSASSSTAAAPVSGYRLYSSINSGAYTLLTTIAGTTYTDTTVLGGYSYTYGVETYGPGGTSTRAISSTLSIINLPATPPSFVYDDPANASNHMTFEFQSAITSSAAPVATTGLQICTDTNMSTGCNNLAFSTVTTSILVNLAAAFNHNGVLYGRLYSVNAMGTSYGITEAVLPYDPLPRAFSPQWGNRTSVGVDLSWPLAPNLVYAPVISQSVKYCKDAAMSTKCVTIPGLTPGTTTYHLDALSSKTTYYAQINVVGSKSTTSGDVGSFTTL